MRRWLWIPVTLLVVTFACREAPPPAVQDISAEALLSSPPAGALVLDVRTPEEFASGHVPGAVNIPHTELADRLSEVRVSKDSPVVVYCERGGRAGQAAEVLLTAGYSDVLHLAGDMSAWRSAGRPVVQESASR